MVNAVVARFADGRTVKGISLDVDPGRASFHVRTPEGVMVDVSLRELKALFFVRSLDGDSAHIEGSEIAPADARRRGARLTRIRFKDGEELVGLTMRFPPNRPYFFVTPVDTRSNNVRILVNKDETADMQLVPDEQPSV